MPHSTIGVGSKGGWETLRDQTHVQTVSVPFAAGTSFVLYVRLFSFFFFGFLFWGGGTRRHGGARRGLGGREAQPGSSTRPLAKSNTKTHISGSNSVRIWVWQYNAYLYGSADCLASTWDQTPRNKRREKAFLVHVVLRLCGLVFDFAARSIGRGLYLRNGALQEQHRTLVAPHRMSALADGRKHTS